MRKSMQLKAVAFAAVAALMGVSGLASASEAAQTAPSTFKPGTYTAQVNGHNAPLTVQVTVGKNRIEKIDFELCADAGRQGLPEAGGRRYDRAHEAC